jgi:hypothetical protein
MSQDERKTAHRKQTKMPRDGAIIFSDLMGKLDVLYVHCEKCSER